jgi:hypothetical protein
MSVNLPYIFITDLYPVYRSAGLVACLSPLYIRLVLLPGVAEDRQGVSLPVLFCFASVHPSAVKRVSDENEAKVLYHIVSHGWFHSTNQLRFTLTRMLQTQVVWANAVIVETGNRSPSRRITNQGLVENGTLLYNSSYSRIVEY